MAAADHSRFQRNYDTVRVTIKQVAQVAKVHYSTVSKALRGSGRIPVATRDRIQRIAEQIGYHKDPVMLALAAQRTRCSALHREPRIVFATNRWSTGDPYNVAFMRKFADGVRHQTELMGYACDLLLLDNDAPDPAEIERRLDAARTDGIIVGAFDPQLRRLELDWSRYGVVKIDSAFMVPGATLVANDQMQIARTAFHNAYRLGYRRIGMTVGRAEERTTQDLYSAGCYIAQDELEIPSIPILYCREGHDYAATAHRVAEWIRAHRLEIVLSTWGSVRELLRVGGLQVPRDIACMCLCLNDPDPALAGVIQHHFVVGQKAAEALALLIVRRKRGLTTPSAATYVAGSWQDGASAPPCGAR
ncbi:MAG TPA: LacI family DNA-binding transcriptional regulator [Opitutaceae bacterium]|nr:LacI family DNA-binding transcriptional regulator [Opitutaceae bacterium]